LRGCVELNNPNIEFEWVDISDFPLFNEDVEKEGIPKPVERVYNQVKHSHGILFGVP
jgi:NAD(P)H-dependent FMN reductase